MTNLNGVCKTLFVHEEVVTEVMDSMPREELLYDLADFFKVVGDTTRIKILHALLVAEMCVCDLSNLLNISQSAVSHQLRTLRQADLVRFQVSSCFFSSKYPLIQTRITTNVITMIKSILTISFRFFTIFLSQLHFYNSCFFKNLFQLK